MGSTDRAKASRRRPITKGADPGTSSAHEPPSPTSSSTLSSFALPYRSDRTPPPETGTSHSSPRDVPPSSGSRERARRAPERASDDPPAREPSSPTPGSKTAMTLSLTEAMRFARSDAARTILRAAGDRAIRRDGEEAATIGVMLILQAAVAVGVTQPRGTWSTPRWLVDLAEAQGISAEKIASYGTITTLASPRRGIMLRRAASLAVRMAVALAKATVGRSRFDARHLIVAVLDSPDRAVAQQMRKDALAVGLDLSALRRSLIERILETPEAGENVGVWLRFLRGADSAWAALGTPAREGPRSGAFPGFDADRASTTDDDPLGIGPDVSAFARLICVEETTTPLSIGLFGEWGSGKSSFMERLQREIGSLTQREHEGRIKRASEQASAEAEPQTGTHFVENVVQIRFNAWHYADANLWASLTAEFFDQLRAGGSERQGRHLHARLVERVNAHVHNLASTLTATREALNESERTLIRAQKARDKAVAAVPTEQRDALSQTLIDAIGTAYEKHKSDLVELGRRAYQDDPSKGIRDFVAVARDVQTIGGQLKTVAAIVMARGWRVALLVLALALVVAAMTGLAPTDKAEATTFLSRMGFWGWFGAVASASGAILPAIRIVAGIVRSTADFAGKLDTLTKDRLKDVLARETELKEAAAEAKARRDAMERAQQALTRYVDADGAASPPRLLHYIIEDDPETKAVGAQIGLISRARRLFQSVEEVVKEERRKRKAGEANDGAVPDRIVLYIDDLDRCTHEQVYEVLQAIHLLLAFQLFVVIVGVDVRWVEEAVARQFVVPVEDLPDSATPEDRDRARQSAEVARRKRAIDYLEKIFQLPFWLRPLATEGEHASYATYVRGLLDANREEPHGSMRQDDEETDEARGDETHDDRRAEAARAPGRERQGPSAEVDAEALDLALATVKLTQAEIDFLASPEIGALAAKSPRAVKRMINVYRIVRARLDGAELAAFLGTGDRPPDWPIAAFLAAVECGQPVEVADDLYLGIKGVEPHRTLAEIADTTAEPFAPVDDSVFADDRPYEALERVRRSCHALWAISAGISEMRGGRTATCGDMLAMARIVRRYSFNRYH